ncbi:Z1 domain-containing protein [Granulosicoccaceae sp. 1_MG-2023]|nr:Z1 domain-containing protein [Granulosicoccaceae sp. 1_MG-2023]
MAEKKAGIEIFANQIRERRASYSSISEVAGVIKQEMESYGALTPERAEAIDAAAEIVQKEQKHVTILRAGSLYRARPDWYKGPDAESYHWHALHNYIRNKKGWAEDTICSLDEASTEIVSLLEDPAQAQFRCRGLVVGYVQSGKTANMTAVIAKAVDAGYNLILVLGGLTNKLRKQTQLRLERDVVDRHRHMWELYTTADDDGDFRRPANGAFHMPREGHAQLIVMKKEGSRLRSLLKTVEKTQPVILKKIKVLLIDDECDHASVNSATNDSDITTINRLIRQVLRRFPAVSYVGYTATPFANVFIDPFPDTTDVPDDLYPSDFITALSRPDGYFGAREVFGADEAEEDSDGRDMIRLIEDAEAAKLRPTSPKDKTSFKPVMTDSLRDAVLWFLAGCAVRRFRGQTEAHMSMLVHCSQYQDQHDYMHELLDSWVQEHRAELEQGTGTLGEYFREFYADEIRRTVERSGHPFPRTFDELSPYLSEVFESLGFAVENGRSEIRLDYESGPVTCIAIGGTVLARGLTLEGLTVSYFLRTSKQYDTLLQMGRWFGYRPGYDDLPRLWTTSELASNFRSLAVIEDEIRQEIAEYKHKDLSPLEFAVRVRSIPGMAITSASKMRHAFRTSMSFAGQHVQTIRFDHKDLNVVRGNWKAAARLFDDAAQITEAEKRKGSLLFRDVPMRSVRKFVADSDISDKHMSLKKEHILAYFDEVFDEQVCWNVGLVQPKAGNSSEMELGQLGHVSTVQRSPLATSAADHADIKALMSVRDVLIDADEEPVSGTKEKLTWDIAKCKRPPVPLLLVYPIDKNSEPKSQGVRTSLNAVGDLVGFGIIFPGDKDRSGDYFSVELDAPVEDEIDDYVEE